MKFYDLVPTWWLKKKKADRPMRIISPLMDIVKNEFGEKEQLRYHNVYKGKMTNAEFEYWWDNFSNTNRSKPSVFNDEKHKKYYERSCIINELHWWEDDVFEKLSAAKVW
jgi:hypothetical protein